MPPKAWEEIKSFVKNLIGNTTDTGGSASTGSVFAKLNTLLTNWPSTRAGHIDTINTNAKTAATKATAAATDAAAVETLIGATGNTGGTTSAGTVFGKLNALLTSWTSTRAGYVDNIRSYTVTNNTASKTGVLSAKASYIIALLENATYGLSAIKNAIASVLTGVSSFAKVGTNITIKSVSNLELTKTGGTHISFYAPKSGYYRIDATVTGTVKNFGGGYSSAHMSCKYDVKKPVGDAFSYSGSIQFDKIEADSDNIGIPVTQTVRLDTTFIEKGTLVNVSGAYGANEYFTAVIDSLTVKYASYNL